MVIVWIKLWKMLIIKGPFGLIYFWAYANKSTFMYYYKFFKVGYEKTSYKDAIFVSKNLWMN
jgi:hypothetical protein